MQTRTLLSLAIASILLAGCAGSRPQPTAGRSESPEPSRPGAFGAEPPPPIIVDPTGNASVPSAGPSRTAWGYVGIDSAEPTIGVNSKGEVFYAAFDDVLRSKDRGATWESVYTYAIGTLDQALTVDDDTDRVWVSHLLNAGACVYLAWSDDGDTWTDRGPACDNPHMDHEKIFSGPAAGSVAGAAYPSVLYLCYGLLNFVISNACSASYDGGVTFPVDRLVMHQFIDGCGGLGNFGAVSRTGLAAVAAGYGCGNGSPGVGLSVNSGLTWSVAHPTDAVGTDTIDPDVAFSQNGTLVLLWQGEDQLAYTTRSFDDGETWTEPVRVSPPHVTSTVFTSVAVDHAGRAAFAYLGTRDDANRSNEVADTARWQLFITEWQGIDDPTVPENLTVHQVTPDDDPVQVGPICQPNSACPDGARNLLEFIDADFSPDGTLFVAFTDGCPDSCAGKPSPTAADSHLRKGAWARLDVPQP